MACGLAHYSLWCVLSWCTVFGCDFVVLGFVNLWAALGFGGFVAFVWWVLVVWVVPLDVVVGFRFGSGLLVWSLVVQCGGGGFRLDFWGSRLRVGWC